MNSTRAIKLPSRNPVVPLRRMPLSEQDYFEQIQKGRYIVHEGVRLAVPSDSLLTPDVYKGVKFWENRGGKVVRPGVKLDAPRLTLQRKALEFLRDRVHKDIPYWYYMATLGHDLHVATWADLYGRHFHANWANPFNPYDVKEPIDPTFHTWVKTYNRPHNFGGVVGFIEDLGWLSGGKVTDAFVSEEIDELVSATGSEYADFDFHEVGTSTQAENNNDTALIATSGIARATGSPTDADPIYRNVGTITADASESWEEHGLFNNSTGAALLDRSLTGGQAVTSSDQVEYTHETTKNPEA